MSLWGEPCETRRIFCEQGEAPSRRPHAETEGSTRSAHPSHTQTHCRKSPRMCLLKVRYGVFCPKLSGTHLKGTTGKKKRFSFVTEAFLNNVFVSSLNFPVSVFFFIICHFLKFVSPLPSVSTLTVLLYFLDFVSLSLSLPPKLLLMVVTVPPFYLSQRSLRQVPCLGGFKGHTPLCRKFIGLVTSGTEHCVVFGWVARLVWACPMPHQTFQV